MTNFNLKKKESNTGSVEKKIENGIHTEKGGYT